MKIILLSGGSGKRLWPLSNSVRSKQFLKILNDHNDKYESMVQRIWRKLDGLNLTDQTYVSTGKIQSEIMKNQLGENVPMIIEPERRDTFPAISLACSYLYSEQKISLDEVICVLPVDAYAEDAFYKKLEELERIVKQSSYDLALLGVKPSYPAESYGYIVPECHSLNKFEPMNVSHFVEKPKQHEAENLIAKNALWNCGVFAFKLQFMISLLKKKNYPTNYKKLLKIYEALPKNSFDYEVVEKCQTAAVIPFSGVWKDLGTWDTLSHELNTPIIGKGIISSDSINTHLINELNIPIVVLGLSNIIVAASSDGIVVTDKVKSSHIKELINNIQQRPMYEERRWGWYKVLDYREIDNQNEILTKRLVLTSGKNLSYQLHHKRSEYWIIISGRGEFVLDGNLRPVKPGDMLHIPIGVKHAIKAHSDLEIIEVQTGTELIEEDIVRICLTWEETLKHCIPSVKD
ncbi:sugar phosphate nucleotidyltransferase [Alkalihalobacillus sp. BA299]|uniref:sugar phosphate nucleotidyltransferase n=1 Tax=Alkalihalobacillus sp. BA299 TaxID=2815938 RepID=UPI001ADCC68C|nr:sugar phosphate nucleotidyltransferase [Alkalihalobacillus sp. BA299]